MSQGMTASLLDDSIDLSFEFFESFVSPVLVPVVVRRVSRVVPDRPSVYLFPVTPSPLSAIPPPNLRRCRALRHRCLVRLPPHPRRVRSLRCRALRTRRFYVVLVCLVVQVWLPVHTPHLAPVSVFISELTLAALATVSRIVLLTMFRTSSIPPNARRCPVTVRRLRPEQQLHRAPSWFRQLRQWLQLRLQVVPQVSFPWLSRSQQLDSLVPHRVRVPPLRAPSRLTWAMILLFLSPQALSVSWQRDGRVLPSVFTRRRHVRRVVSVVQSELQLLARVVVRVVVLVSVPWVPRAHRWVHRWQSGLRVQSHRKSPCLSSRLTRLLTWFRQVSLHPFGWPRR